MRAKAVRALILTAGLSLGGCASLAARDCQNAALRADPDEAPTTQGHDRAQALMAECMKIRGYEFDWNLRECDREYPRTIAKGRCYRREPLAAARNNLIL
jgi:hypothetical protein